MGSGSELTSRRLSVLVERDPDRAERARGGPAGGVKLPQSTTEQSASGHSDRARRRRLQMLSD